ncbi:MAG: nickel ABC transporter substrate-binding protein [Intestinibacter sp.]
MKKLKKLTAILLSCILLVCILAGCSSQNSGSSEKSKNTITIGVGADIGHMNPHLSSGVKIYAQNLIYEGLLAYNSDGTIEKVLAEDYNISEDGKTLTFNIRKGVKYSDGSELDAKSVLRNYQAVLDHKENHTWLGLLNHITKMETPDDYTFVITLDEAYYPAIQEISNYRPLRMLADAGFPEGDDTSEKVEKTIGTGKWVLADYKENEYAKFEVNENYWGEKPKIDGFTLKVMPDSESTTSALEAGEIDMIYDMYGSTIMSIDSYEYLGENDFNTFISDPTITRLLLMNTGSENLSDIKVRQALAIGLDRETLAENVFKGTEEVADSMFKTTTPYCDVKYKSNYDYDIEKAKKLLDQAGWKLAEGDTYRKKDGKELEINLYYDGSDSVKASMSQIAQSLYEKLGVKLNIQSEESSAAYDRMYTTDWDMIYYNGWGEPYDPHSTLMNIGAEGSALYNARLGIKNADKQYKMLLNAVSSDNEDERVKLYSDLLNDLQSEYFYIPLTAMTNKAACASNITGVKFNTAFDMILDNVEITDKK